MKYLCSDYRCGWRGEHYLTAPNPFEPTDTVTGCPDCKSINTIVNACDEPGCWEQTSCGTPTPEGYRTTCGKHRPIDTTAKPTR